MTSEEIEAKKKKKKKKKKRESFQANVAGEVISMPEGKRQPSPSWVPKRADVWQQSTDTNTKKGDRQH